MIVSGGVAGTIAPVERIMDPVKPFRLVRVMVAVAVDPDANEMDVGLIVKLKSLTTTWRVTVLARVSGLPSESIVA